jgi:hypothetical protein
MCGRRGIPCAVIDPRLPGCGRLNNAQRRYVAAAAQEGRQLMQPSQFAALLTPSLWLEAAGSEGARVNMPPTERTQSGRPHSGGEAGITSPSSQGMTDGLVAGQLVARERGGGHESAAEVGGGAEHAGDLQAHEDSGGTGLYQGQSGERHGNYRGEPTPLASAERAQLVRRDRFSFPIVFFPLALQV